MLIEMETLVVILVLTILGLVCGSFAGAQVWRLRARQLRADKRDGEEYDKRELRTLDMLLKPKIANDRSRCLSCRHTLSAIDLIPLVSWLLTKGRCRYCRKPIGTFEPLIEVGAAAVFVSLFLCWPGDLASGLEVTKLILWLIASIALIMLFAYDVKWFLLPNILVAVTVVVGLAVSAITISQATQPILALTSIVYSVLILSGIYAVLWGASKGAWIGFGDVKLGLGLALLLADWRLAFIALFAANAVGSLIVLPQLLIGRVSRTTRIPFGPLLIVGAYIALWFGSHILQWYSGLLV